jgi:RNA-binding protein YhbY
MQIGKGGITENLIKTVSDALEARELVKLSVLDNCGEDPRAILDALCEALAMDGAELGVVLMELEMDGFIDALPGLRYARRA